MSGYEYANARLRAMRSRLLSRAELNGLTDAFGLAELIGVLVLTPYRRAVEISLVQSSDLESIDEALRRDFIQTVTQIRGFFEGDERTLVDLILRIYDVDNLKTVLRGLSHQAPRSDIERALLPVGSLSAVILNELLRASSPRTAIDVLATLRHPFAQPLLVLRVERPGSGLFEIELALDRWYYREAFDMLKNAEDGAALTQAALNLEADIANLLVILRFLHAPEEKRRLQLRLERGGLDNLFNGAGSLGIERLNHVLNGNNLKTALALLEDHSFYPAVVDGLQAYERSGRLSEIEQAMRRYQLHWLAWQIAKDPLGIGVFLGYLALKKNEIANLRRIARSILIRQNGEAIRAELEYVS